MNWNPAWGALDPAATKKCCQCGGGNKQGHSVTAAPTSSPTARPTGGKTSSACTLASPINTGCTGKAAGAFCGTHLAYSAKYRGKMAFPFRCTKDSQQRYPLVCQYCPNGDNAPPRPPARPCGAPYFALTVAVRATVRTTFASLMNVGRRAGYNPHACAPRDDARILRAALVGWIVTHIRHLLHRTHRNVRW